MVKVHDKFFVPFLTKEIIRGGVEKIAQQINHDYIGKRPLIIGVLNGAFIFAADLFRNLENEPEISFIKLSSYKGTSSTGKIITAIGLNVNITERHVILVEDIIDTGKTIAAFLPELQKHNPASVKIAALLLKPDALECNLQPDYCGFEIENKFVVGYGLDYNELGRNLPEIYILKDEE